MLTWILQEEHEHQRCNDLSDGQCFSEAIIRSKSYWIFKDGHKLHIRLVKSSLSCCLLCQLCLNNAIIKCETEICMFKFKKLYVNLLWSLTYRYFLKFTVLCFHAFIVSTCQCTIVFSFIFFFHCQKNDGTKLTADELKYLYEGFCNLQLLKNETNEMKLF